MRPVIFREDVLVTYYTGLGDCWVRPEQPDSYGDVELVPGDYVLVISTVKDVGGGYIGVDSLGARSLNITKTLKLPNWPMREPHPNRPVIMVSLKEGLEEEVELFPMTQHVQLSEAQRRLIVDHIKNVHHYWWDNATPQVRQQLSPGSVESAEDKARRLLREAAALLLQSCDFKSSKRMIEEALALDPGISRAHAELAKIAIESGNVQQAIENLHKELTFAREADAFTAHAYLAVIYEIQGRIADAQRHAAAAMETQHYKQYPGGVALVPEVRRKIQVAVEAERDLGVSSAGQAAAVLKDPQSRASMRTAAQKRRWWEFWKIGNGVGLTFGGCRGLDSGLAALS